MDIELWREWGCGRKEVVEGRVLEGDQGRRLNWVRTQDFYFF